MSYISIASGLKVQSASAIDSRLFLTKAQMKEAHLRYILPSTYFCICPDDGKIYLYNETNDIDPELGLYRLIDYSIATKQDKLTAGTNIEITADNVISAVNDITAQWGSITGTLGDQSDLQIALNAKANTTALADHVGDLDVHVAAADRTTWNAKQNEIQKTTLPSAALALLGEIYQYTGETTTDFTNGMWYKCTEVEPVTDPRTFQWVEMEGGKSKLSELKDVSINDVSSGQALTYNATTGKWTNTSSTQTDTIAVGTILSFGNSVLPTGYLLCDGSAVSRTEYTLLFGAIGTAFGPGDGSTTFNLPNYYETDTKYGIKYSYGAPLDLLPDGNGIGIISSFAGSGTPVGYLDCDGTAKSKTTYSELFNIIGYSMTPEYSDKLTYAVGDYAVYLNALYKCIVAIPAAESWTAEHWEKDTTNFFLPYIETVNVKYCIKYIDTLAGSLLAPDRVTLDVNTAGNMCISNTYKDKIDNAVPNTRTIATLPLSTDITVTALKDALKQAIIDDLYPVGSKYIQLDETEPATKFGGTWEIDTTFNGRALWADSTKTVGTSIAAGLPIPKATFTGSKSTTGSGYCNMMRLLNGKTVGSWGNNHGPATTGTDSIQDVYGNAFPFSSHWHDVTPNGSVSINADTIYKSSNTTVQPPAITCKVWKRTA